MRRYLLRRRTVSLAGYGCRHEAHDDLLSQRRRDTAEHRDGVPAIRRIFQPADGRLRRVDELRQSALAEAVRLSKRMDFLREQGGVSRCGEALVRRRSTGYGS